MLDGRFWVDLVLILPAFAVQRDCERDVLSHSALELSFKVP